jgi:hypothetical protein
MSTSEHLPRTLAAVAAILLGIAAPAAAETGRVATSSQPRLLRDGWRLTAQIAPIFPNSDLGDSQDLLAASTGISPCINLGYELRYGDIAITPGFAVQFARFGMRYQDGSVLYLGAQPNVQAAIHLGRFVPYVGLGLGVDQFRITGKIADIMGNLGLNTSASGLGLDLQFGLNAILTPTVALGVALQLHPGYTEFKLEDTDYSGGAMAFTSVLFGVTCAL